MTSLRSSCSCRQAPKLRFLSCPVLLKGLLSVYVYEAVRHYSRAYNLTNMQDDSNPDFVAEVVELYFEDSAGKLEKLDAKLAAPVPDFNEVDQLVHQFKGSSASFGAQGLASLCVQASL